MSDLNLNVNSNLSSQTSEMNGPTETKAAAPKNATGMQQIPQDSLSSISDPNAHKFLATYTSNMAHPTLIKPEDKGKFGAAKEGTATQRDSKAENEAGSLATSAQVTDAKDQTVINQAPVQGQKQQGDDDQGGGKGQGDGSGHGKGQKEQAMPLNEVMNKLQEMINSGEPLPQMTGKDISDILNRKTGKKEGVSAEEANIKTTVGPDGIESNVIDFTVKGNVISGPFGELTIPAGKSSVANPSDVVFNTYNFAKNVSDATAQLAAQLPNSPEKMSLASFLMRVTDALNKFQQALYSTNNVTSEQIRSKTQAQLETALKKIEDQFKKMREMMEKQKEADKKQKSLGIMSSIFSAVGIIMSVVLAVVTLGMGFWVTSILTPFLILSISSMVTQLATQKSVVARLFEALDSLLEKIMGAIGIEGDAQNALKILTKILVVVIVCVAVVAVNPVVFVMGGVSNVIDFITQSGVIGEFVGAVGGDKKAQMITTIVVTAVIMFAALVAGLAMMFLPGGQAAVVSEIAGAATNAIRQVMTAIMNVLVNTLKMTEKVAKFITDTLKMMVKLIINPGFWATLTSLGVQTTETVMTVQMHNLLGDIAKLRGIMEKDAEIADALIFLMKKVIEKLLESLAEVAKYIAKVSGMIEKNIDDMAASVSNLWSA